MKIVYMGTPEFAALPLKSLIESKHEVICILTQPDRAKGRGNKLAFSPVKEVALESGIRLLQPDRLKENDELIAELENLNPDVMVVAAYGKILPAEILSIPKMGCYNIHASLLPKWRGAAPIQWAILEGESKTGITIMKMDEGLDTGDIALQGEMEIDGMDLTQLTLSLSKMGSSLLLEALAALEKGTLSLKKQDDNQATYASIIKKEDGRIDFNIINSSGIVNMIRAFSPWPGVFSSLNEERIKFIDGYSVKDDYHGGAPAGTVVDIGDDAIYISTKDGIFALTHIQAPGKKAMKVSDYLRGHAIKVGDIFN